MSRQPMQWDSLMMNLVSMPRSGLSAETFAATVLPVTSTSTCFDT